MMWMFLGAKVTVTRSVLLISLRVKRDNSVLLSKSFTGFVYSSFVPNSRINYKSLCWHSGYRMRRKRNFSEFNTKTTSLRPMIAAPQVGVSRPIAATGIATTL